MKEKVLICTLVLILTTSSIPLVVGGGWDDPWTWIVDGDTVFVDNEFFYAGASPATISSSGWVEFEFELYDDTWDDTRFDSVWMFNRDQARPTHPEIWRYYEHTLIGYDWFEHWSDTMVSGITSYSSIGIENFDSVDVAWGNINNTLLYEIDCDVGIDRPGTIYVAFSEFINHHDGSGTLIGNNDVWEQYEYYESFWDWKPLDKTIGVSDISFEGMTKRYSLDDMLVQSDHRYRVRCWVEVPFGGLDGDVGKYWWGIKPSDESVSEAVDSGHFFCLDPWWDTQWYYRKPITFDSSQVDSDLVNFPVLINITDTDLRDLAQEDGDDIVFTLSDNVTVLSHEIEKFDGGTGELVAWVNITSLSSGVDTVIQMYYKNDGATNQQDVVGTWNSGFMAVWHMNDAAGNVVDSTGNGVTLTAVNTPTYGDVGAAGDCLRFDGSTESLYEGTTFLDVAEDECTFEVWFNRDDENNGYDGMMGKLYTTDSGQAFLFMHAEDDASNNRHIAYVRAWDQTFYWTPINGALEDKWFYGAYTVSNGSSMHHHLNETLITNSWTYCRNSSLRPFTIAAFEDLSPTNGFFDGRIDEVRVSDVVRSDDWLNTTYHCILNGTDGGFFSVGGDVRFEDGLGIHINSKDIVFHCDDNENYTAEGLHFEKISMGSDWVEWNYSRFDCSFDVGVNVTLNYITDDFTPYGDLTVMSFNFTQQGHNLHTFNISGFLGWEMYEVYTNGTLLENVTSTSDGFVNFTVDIFEGQVVIVWQVLLIFHQLGGEGGGRGDEGGDPLYDEVPLNNSMNFLQVDGWWTTVSIDYTINDPSTIIEYGPTIWSGEDSLNIDKAQTFMVNDTGTSFIWVTNVSLWVWNVLGVASGFDMYFYLCANTPSGVPPVDFETNYLGTSVVNISDFPGGAADGGWMNFSFDDYVKIDSMTNYSLIIKGDARAWDCYWKYITPQQYDDGMAYILVGGVWTAVPARDRAFKLWGFNDSTAKIVNVTMDWFNVSLGDWEEYGFYEMVYNNTISMFNSNFTGVGEWWWRCTAEGIETGVSHREDFSFTTFYMDFMEGGMSGAVVLSLVGMVVSCLFLLFWRRKRKPLEG